MEDCQGVALAIDAEVPAIVEGPADRCGEFMFDPISAYYGYSHGGFPLRFVVVVNEAGGETTTENPARQSIN
ncbi:MAG: hypothetical protein ABS910_05845 [Arthrobacter sp.]